MNHFLHASSRKRARDGLGHGVSVMELLVNRPLRVGSAFTTFQACETGSSNDGFAIAILKREGIVGLSQSLSRENRAVFSLTPPTAPRVSSKLPVRRRRERRCRHRHRRQHFFSKRLYSNCAWFKRLIQDTASSGQRALPQTLHADEGVKPSAKFIDLPAQSRGTRFRIQPIACKRFNNDDVSQRPPPIFWTSL